MDEGIADVLDPYYSTCAPIRLFYFFLSFAPLVCPVSLPIEKVKEKKKKGYIVNAQAYKLITRPNRLQVHAKLKI